MSDNVECKKCGCKQFLVVAYTSWSDTAHGHLICATCGEPHSVMLTLDF
jgi:hypothetical protein